MPPPPPRPMAKALRLLSLTSYFFSNSPFFSQCPLLAFSLSLLSISSLVHRGFVAGLDLLFFNFGWLWLNSVVAAMGGLWMFVVAMVGCKGGGLLNFVAVYDGC